MLTATGTSLLSDARQVLSAVDRFGARASAVAEGLELEVSVAVSALCPSDLLIAFGKAFHEHFPSVALRVQTEVMDAVPGLVLDGTCQLGISGPFAEGDLRLERRFLTHISLVPVAASDHPLTQKNSPLTRSDLRDEVQIVIAQRAAAKSEVTHSVFSSKTWRVADASTKLDLIRAGLGWGFLPLNLVQADLQRGTLTQLALEERSPEPLQAPSSAITLSASPPGPAGRWLLDQMAVICDTCPKAEKG